MSHGHHANTGASPESIAAGHEQTDAEPKNIVVFTIWLTVTLVITVSITYFLYWAYNNGSMDDNNAEFTASPLNDPNLQPPSPPIQPSGIHHATEVMDIGHYFEEYNRMTASYGSDVMADHVSHDRIPVAAAIALLAQNGLPAGPDLKDVPAPQGTGLSVPTPYSDGGRGMPDLDRAAAPGIPGQ
jgi:hypothetical protein